MSNAAEMPQTKNAGAVKGGAEGYLFDLPKMKGFDTGTGYATTHGPVVEGDRMQVGLMHKPRGTGARPHSHPNEQWNYVVQGKLRVSIEGEPDRIVGPGTLIYFPANKVHATVALPEEDVIFLVAKDLSHGIIGNPADGKRSGAHYEPGFEPKG
jgi:quercetin dioxygenase-like cupin family protein